MASPLSPEQETRRRLLFTPCRTKEEVKAWVYAFFKFDLPDVIVDEASTNPSTITPLGFLWKMYSRLMYPIGGEDDPAEMLTYAAREAGKTVIVAAMEVLCLLHVGTDVVHLAAILEQAQDSQGYVKGFLEQPDLRGLMVGDAKERTTVIYYRPRSGDGPCLYQKEFKALPAEERENYRQVVRWAVIVAASVRATNGKHVGFLCVHGDTHLTVSSAGPRRRKTVTARSLFRLIKGLSPGGRPGGEVEEVVEEIPAGTALLSVDPVSGERAFVPVVRAVRSRRPTVRIRLASTMPAGGDPGARKRSGRLSDGSRSLVCTPDHPVLVAGRGFVQAAELRPGDRVTVLGRTHTENEVHVTGRAVGEDPAPRPDAPLDGDPWDQVVLGSLLGDAGVYYKGNSNPWMSERHCVAQAAYLDWKRQILSLRLRTKPLVDPRSGYTGAEQVGYYGHASPDLLPYRDFRRTLAGVERLSALGLAVWYMDDGCAGRGLRIASECFDAAQHAILIRTLRERFGIETQVMPYERDGRRYLCLVGDTEAKRRLVEVCRPHVHPDLAYKFDLERHRSVCEYCGGEVWFYEAGTGSRTCDSVVCRLVRQEVLRLEPVLSVEPCEEDWVYDFTLARSHTYISNGIVSHNCLDELDIVADPRIIGEARNIPSPIRNEDGSTTDPLTVYISTRKTAFGPVQRAIDEAKDTGLVVDHFNLLDVTERCPEKRHRPDLPRLRVYRSEETLRAVDEATFQTFDPKTRSRYVPDEAYAGCMSNCRIFASCKGQLATRPEVGLDSFLVKPLSHVVKKLTGQGIEYVQSQLLCLKPMSTGLIYGHLLDPKRHVLSPAQCYERVFGAPPPEGDRLTKVALIEYLKLTDVAWGGGQDYGMAHDFAQVSGFTFGTYAFVLRGLAAPGLDNDQKLEYVEPIRQLYDPDVWGDVEDPSAQAYFAKHRWRMKQWVKLKGSVKTGIDIVKDKMRPPGDGGPEIFFVFDVNEDPEMVDLWKKLREHAWKLDAAGRPTDLPSEIHKDVADALRYWIMNKFPFRRGSGMVVAGMDRAPPAALPGPVDLTRPQDSPIMRQIVDGIIGSAPVVTRKEDRKRSTGRLRFV